MRSFRRDTAAAFGDEPDRGVEAEFGASPALAAALKAVKGVQSKAAAVAAPAGGRLAPKAPTKASSASVKVQAPKLAVVATPKPAPPKPAVAAKPAATVKVAVAAPNASAKVVTTAKPTSSAPAKPAVATTAQQGNFLDAGSAPLAAPAVKLAAGAVAMTPEQRAANARALLKAKTQATAAANAGYLRDRQKEENERAALHAHLLATDPAYAARDKAIHKAGLDTAQITMGAKVIAIGAAVIASGGAAAGAVGVTTGGAALASAAAADRLVAAVEKGGELGKKAKGVIADVKAAAAKGDAVAKEALGSLEAVAKERIANAVPKGVEQTLTAAAKDAANAVAGVATGLSGSGSLNLSAALSAAAGRAPPSSGYSGALTGQRRPVASSNAPAKQLSQFDTGPQQPRWLVTPEGRVVDLNRSPGKADDRGYLVTTAGKVLKQ